MNIEDKIFNLIGINFKVLFQDFLDFYDTNYNEIVQYYTNKNSIYPNESFITYNNLLNRTNELINKLFFYKDNLLNIEYWNLIIQLDDLKQKLEEVPYYPKYYQISFVNKQNNNFIYDTYVLKQNENLNTISEDLNENWIDIAILNNLTEENYTNKGGVKIILKDSLSVSDDNVDKLSSICDYCIGKNVLGKDLPNYISFDLEESDLEVDSPEQTFVHTVQRLFSLKRGSIPEYDSLGIQKDIVNDLNNNNNYTLPILIRQLSDTLNDDDTIVSFQIDDIIKENDCLKIYATVKNRLYENLKFTIDALSNE